MHVGRCLGILKDHFSTRGETLRPQLFQSKVNDLLNSPELKPKQAVELFELLVGNLEPTESHIEPSTVEQVLQILDKIEDLSKGNSSILNMLAGFQLPTDVSPQIVNRYIGVLSKVYDKPEGSLSKLIKTANSGLLESKKDIFVKHLNEKYALVIKSRNNPLTQRLINDLPSFGNDILKEVVRENHVSLSQNGAPYTQVGDSVYARLKIGLASTLGFAQTLTLPADVAEEVDAVTLSEFKTNMSEHNWGDQDFQPIELPGQGVVDSLTSAASKQLTKDKVDFYTYVNEYFSGQKRDRIGPNFDERVKSLVDFYENVKTQTNKSFSEIFELGIDDLSKINCVTNELFKDNPTLLADITNFQCKNLFQIAKRYLMESYVMPLEKFVQDIDKTNPSFEAEFWTTYSKTLIKLYVKIFFQNGIRSMVLANKMVCIKWPWLIFSGRFGMILLSIDGNLFMDSDHSLQP